MFKGGVQELEADVEKEDIGGFFKVIRSSATKEVSQPLSSVVIRIIEYVPDSVYVWLGF